MFNDRVQAGEELAKNLLSYRGQAEVLVMGIARGGVVVGDVVARILELPLGVAVVKKLGYPGNPEFAIGAVDADGEYFLNPEFIQLENTAEFQRILEQAQAEVTRRSQLFNPAPKETKGKTVILVDDGIATGQTNLAAVQYLKRHGVKKIIVAAPVASPEAVELLSRSGVKVVVLQTPLHFAAVGQFYSNFPQLTDEEVLAIIDGVFPAPSS